MDISQNVMPKKLPSILIKTTVAIAVSITNSVFGQVGTYNPDWGLVKVTGHTVTFPKQANYNRVDWSMLEDNKPFQLSTAKLTPAFSLEVTGNMFAWLIGPKDTTSVIVAFRKKGAPPVIAIDGYNLISGYRYEREFFEYPKDPKN